MHAHLDRKSTVPSLYPFPTQIGAHTYHQEFFQWRIRCKVRSREYTIKKSWNDLLHLVICWCIHAAATQIHWEHTWSWSHSHACPLTISDGSQEGIVEREKTCVDIFQTSSVNILVKQDGLNADHRLKSHILD